MARRKITEARKRDYAEAMRANPTPAEHALAQALRRHALRPRRQVIVKGYIVDFLFPSAMLVVEVDGHYHFTAKGRAGDRVRTRVLSEHGYTVIRFSNAKVMAAPDECVTTIKQKLHSKA